MLCSSHQLVGNARSIKYPINPPNTVPNTRWAATEREHTLGCEPVNKGGEMTSLCIVRPDVPLCHRAPSVSLVRMAAVKLHSHTYQPHTALHMST